jgi:drug/metabolite transporter (DMT)-like permease
LAQKQVLKFLPSENIMFFIYLMGTLLFFPFANPLDFFKLNGLGLALLLFCAFNTLIAYGSFAEALNHWEASLISMILATTPLITVMGMKGCAILFPGFIKPEQLNMVSILGAVLVVVGSVLCVLKRIHHKNV